MNDSTGYSRTSRASAHRELKGVVRRISSRPIGNGTQVKITLVVSAEWAGVAQAAVAFLDETVSSIHRHSESSLRQVRVKAIVSRDEAARKEVWKRYQALRMDGLKHREAVYKLVEDTSLFYHGRWKFSDYNWCVRTNVKGIAELELKKAGLNSA